jgi:iron complex outermembrane receptor protein
MGFALRFISFRTPARLFLISAWSVFVFGGGVAWAADSTDENSGALEEVVVTARKQSESIMGVPVAVSAVSSADLNRYAIADVQDLGSRFSGVSFDTTASSPNGGTLAIRGIGSSSGDSAIDGAVSVVIDGVQTSRSSVLIGALVDLAQAEVLKGPQALFFGKNSPGGVISLTSNGPTDKLEGYAQAGYGFGDGSKIVEGAISGPVTDTISARAAIRFSDSDGFIRDDATQIPNPYGGSALTGGAPYDKNGARNYVGRITLEWTPTADIKVTFRNLASENESNGPAADQVVTSCGDAGHPNSLGGVPDPASGCGYTWHNSVPSVPAAVAASDRAYRNGVPYGVFWSELPSLTIDFAPSGYDVTSVTGYYAYENDRDLVTPTNYGWGFLGQFQKYHQFSEELRAVTKLDGPVNFTGGFYYENTNLVNRDPNALIPTAPDPATGSVLTYVFNSLGTSETYSAFGQARWKITDAFEIDAGARYSHDGISNSQSNSYVNPTTFAAVPLVAQGVFFTGDRHYDNTSPEVTLNWTPAADALLYVSYKKGYKAGSGSSSSILPITFNFKPDNFFAPETISGYEVGFKTTQLDHRLRLTADAYTYEYKNLQVSNFDATTFEIQSLNAGAVRTKGVEAEVLYEPVRQLTLHAAATYGTARYISFADTISCYPGQTTGCDPATHTEDLSGKQKYRSPDFTGTVGITYETPIAANLFLGASANVRWSSSYFTQEDNDPAAVQKAYQVYDANINVHTPDDRYELAVIGRNLTDKEYVVASLHLPNSGPGSIESTVAPPRVILLQGTFRF